MSTHRTTAQTTIDTPAPAWVRAWVNYGDLQDLTAEQMRTLRAIADGTRAVREAWSDIDVVVLDSGTGSRLHAPDLSSDETERACSQGNQRSRMKRREYAHIRGWRPECDYPECQDYFDALEAAGVIDRPEELNE